MAATDQMPAFNLKAVLQETGLKPDTLRAWERRYGLPQPERSPGGHRLYSQRDIETIKWLVARQGEGLSISRAVDLWRGLEAEGQDPLGVAEFADEAPTGMVSVPAGGALADFREAWKSACLAYDERTAEQLITQAFALYPVEVVCLDLLQKGVAEVGEGWYRGEATVQQEHFASELAMRRLEALLAASPPPARPDRILMVCPPYEEHTFSPLMLTLLLRRRSWDVVYLGANVPVSRLESALVSTKPKLVVLSAQQLHTAASLLEVAHFLRGRRVSLAYGGLIFNLLPALRSRIPGHFLGEGLDQAPHKVEQILSSPYSTPAFEAVPENYQQVLNQYRERHSLIEAQMWRAMNSAGMSHENLSTANTHLAHNIMAALTLGDMDFLGVDIEWVEGLLGNHGLPSQLLYDYLSVYYQAAKQHMDEHAAPVVNWLERVVTANAG
jgi:DNA-binding transcriptional MerR regulator